MEIKTKIENWVKDTLGRTEIVLMHPKELKNGDYTLIINSDTAEEDFEKLSENKIKEVEKVEFVAPRFINIFLSKEFFADSVVEINSQENFGHTNLLEGEKLFIEHTQPNPFKEFHIGHLMNNSIGESVYRITKANGAEVKVCSYHGDVGLHVAKAIWGKIQNPYFKWGEAYAHGSQNFENNVEEIEEINKKVYEKSDEKINELYKNGRKDSLGGFEEMYEKLDSKFNFHFYESEAGEIGKEIVKENINKIFEESEGAVIFRGENFEPKTHTRVFLNKNGLPTYEAKEVGLAKIKKEKWPEYTQSITVTANEQDSFFGVVEVAIGEVFPDRKGKLRHLSHGMLKLPTGKMSSRTGDVITARSLINQVRDKILEKLKDREYGETEKDTIAEIVAIGAIKYSILRQAIGGDIIFNFDKSLSFEGDSGPYLQYTYVRAKSVLERAGINYTTPKVSKVPFDTPTEVEKLLYRFPEIVERAGREYSPHYIVTYLTELAGAFNSFYGTEKIIDESDPQASTFKLALTSAVAQTLKNGLRLLGIKVPKRM